MNNVQKIIEIIIKMQKLTDEMYEALPRKVKDDLIRRYQNA